MNKWAITGDRVLRHKDIAPDRKWDIGDNFWNEKYEDWGDYQLKLQIMSYYKDVFDRENKDGSTILNDLDGAYNRCVKDDGTLDAKEFFWLIQVELERIKK